MLLVIGWLVKCATNECTRHVLIMTTKLAGPGSLRAHIDRTQAARLYAGNIEYGYFVRDMEARCQQAGVAAGQDADQLIAFAATLSEEDLRSVQGVFRVSAELVQGVGPELVQG